MTTNYADALAEVDYILNLLPKDLLNKIPNSFLNFIKTKKTINYKIEIDEDVPLDKQPLKNETKAIISLIYRSYLCSPTMKRRYKIDDEIELRKKYNINNLIKKDSHF